MMRVRGGHAWVRRGLPALDSGAGTADSGPKRGVVWKRRDCGVAGDDGRAAAQAWWSASYGAARLGSALAVRGGAAPGVQWLAAARGSDGARGCRQRLAASSSRCSAMQGTADGQQFFVVMWPAQSCVCSVHATETNRVTPRDGEACVGAAEKDGVGGAAARCVSSGGREQENRREADILGPHNR
uniref:Uncharacterized protein n=1 Tax=Oryza glumipatula TaxID=40148 RepID=A0A0E0AHJ2_9ORYZ